MSFIKENNNDVLIVSFGSMGRRPSVDNLNDNKLFDYFDFFNFLPDNFKNVDLHYYGDLDQYCYHKGIRGISDNIENTVTYLREKINNRYIKVIFMGLSAGGYAAILFGSILNVDHIVAFYPITQLVENRPNYEEKYKDVLPYINKITHYHLFGVSKSCNKHHFSQQCQRICISPNVMLQVYNVTDNIKILMKECHAYDVLNKIINSEVKHLKFLPIYSKNKLISFCSLSLSNEPIKTHNKKDLSNTKPSL
jgi:hypothetical protein